MQKNIDKEKMREFCQKYRRYIAAAVLLILIVLIVVLVVFVSREDDPKDTQKPLDSTQQETQPEDDSAGDLSDGKLQKDADEELVTLINSYYTAYAAADLTSIEMLAAPITDNEKSFITTVSAFYEAYQNIACYSMKATDSAYFVSVCYDLKFYDIDTPAPGMDFFYVERDGEGKLYINNVYANYNFSFMEQEYDSGIYKSIRDYEQLSEVALLQQEVQIRYDEAMKSDEKLASMVSTTLHDAITQWRAGVTDNTVSTEPTEGTEDDTQPEETEAPDTQTDTPEPDSTADTDTDSKPEDSTDADTNTGDNSTAADNSGNGTWQVRTKDVCNIRAAASSDAELIGQIGEGAQLTAVGTEGNWTKIQFSGGTGYIRSDLLEPL